MVIGRDGIPIIIFFASWEAASLLGLLNQDLAPSISSVIIALGDLFASGRLIPHLLITFYRTVAGLIVGILLGTAIGISMARSVWARKLVNPLVSLTYPLPKPAIIPLTMIWWGVGDLSKIVVVIVGCLLPMVVNTYYGVRNVDKFLIWSARSMGTPPRMLLWKVMIPSAMPYILSGIRIALAFSFVIIIANEFVASRAGLGNLIMTFGEAGVYNYMFAVILAAIIVAFIADRVLLKWSKRILHWYSE